MIACTQNKLKDCAYYDKRIVHDEKFHVSPLYHNNLYDIKHLDLINKNALLNLTNGNPDTNQQFRPRKEKHYSDTKLKDYLKKDIIFALQIHIHLELTFIISLALDRI